MSGVVADILEQSLGEMVVVRLKAGKILRGRLKGFDEHLNVLLAETEDITEAENVKKLGLIILRGDNVVLILLPQG
jgi:small nuclear ribonucleoprotein